MGALSLRVPCIGESAEELREILVYGLISRAELKAKLDRGDSFVLVDTLPETAYRKGHLPGAISIPSDDMLAVAPKRIADRDADIVV